MICSFPESGVKRVKLFELFATLELQTNKFNDGINKAQSMAQRFAGKVQSTVTAGTVALGNLMARGAEVAINAVRNVGKEALNLTGQLEQVVVGSEAVFGVWAEDIQKKSSEAFKPLIIFKQQIEWGLCFKDRGIQQLSLMSLQPMQCSALPM